MKYILLIIFVLILAALACIVSINFENGSIADSTLYREHATLSAAATATFGAEQFHLQLTAIASEEQ